MGLSPVERAARQIGIAQSRSPRVAVVAAAAVRVRDIGESGQVTRSNLGGLEPGQQTGQAAKNIAPCEPAGWEKLLTLLASASPGTIVQVRTVPATWPPHPVSSLIHQQSSPSRRRSKPSIAIERARP